MVFEITAAAVPIPKSEERGSRHKLQPGEPAVLLQRDQTAGSPAKGRGEAAKHGFFFGCGKAWVKPWVYIGRNRPGSYSDGYRRYGQVHVTTTLRIKATERNGRRGARFLGERNEGVVERSKATRLDKLRGGAIGR